MIYRRQLHTIGLFKSFDMMTRLRVHVFIGHKFPLLNAETRSPGRWGILRLQPSFDDLLWKGIYNIMWIDLGLLAVFWCNNSPNGTCFHRTLYTCYWMPAFGEDIWMLMNIISSQVYVNCRSSYYYHWDSLVLMLLITITLVLSPPLKV